MQIKLSELVYEIVKNVKYLDDPGFTYESFIAGEYDNDIDYSNSINNVFTPLNTAIHRLSDRHKLKNKVVILNPIEKGFTDITSISNDIKTILNVFYFTNKGEYTKVSHREFGRDKLLINNGNPLTVYYMEYIQDIPRFKRKDFYYREDESVDVDLTYYGINNTMVEYIIEYCKGMLFETIAPEIANLHLTRAEQYFDDLDNQQTLFSQNTISTKYKY